MGKHSKNQGKTGERQENRRDQGKQTKTEKNREKTETQARQRSPYQQNIK